MVSLAFPGGYPLIAVIRENPAIGAMAGFCKGHAQAAFSCRGAYQVGWRS